MIVDLQKYRFHVGSGAAELFTTNNRKEMEKILVGHLKAKEMEQIPASITEFVYETMRRNSLLASGLQIIEVKSGAGPTARRGDTITLHYIGRLKDGKTFDKTLEPITITLKEGIFIKGFEQGVIGMKAGGTRKLIVPPELGYGKEAVGDIPASPSCNSRSSCSRINPGRPAVPRRSEKVTWCSSPQFLEETIDDDPFCHAGCAVAGDRLSRRPRMPSRMKNSYRKIRY